MKINYGIGTTHYGPGISIDLTGDEVVTAIEQYLKSMNVVIDGPRTIKVNNESCKKGQVYVDPSGSVTFGTQIFNGSGIKS